MAKQGNTVCLALAIGASLAAGCAAESAPLAVDEQPIVGGATTTDYPAVPQIITVAGGEGSSCSGTLITPRVVLTAAHCIDVGAAISTQYVYFGSKSSGTDPVFIEQIDVIDREFYDPWSLSGNDIALLLLEHDSQVEPMNINRTPLTNADIGRSLHLVGWGITSGGGTDSGTKRHVTSQIDGYHNSVVLSYGTSNANTCQGDSGGPGFITRSGEEVVASVTSWGTGGCLGNSGATRVAKYVAWIDDWIATHDLEIAPTVDIVRPIQGEQVGAFFVVEANATDDVGVEMLEMYVNGALVEQSNVPPFIFNVNGLPEGQATIEVRAYDSRDLMDSAQVTVTVKTSCDGAADCPADHNCTGGMCVPIPPTGGIGDACDGNSDCVSGRCAQVGDDQYCTDLCELADDNSCPSGFECKGSTGEGTGACVFADDDEGTSGGCGASVASGRSSGAGAVVLLLACVVLGWRRRKR